MNTSPSKVQSDVEGFIAQVGSRDRYGNDIVNILNKIKEWAAALELDGMAKDALHTVYHYCIEVLVPYLKEMLPTYGDLIMDTIVLPLLAKLHDAYFPHPVV